MRGLGRVHPRTFGPGASAVQKAPAGSWRGRSEAVRGERGDVEARSAAALGGLRAALQEGAALEALACYHDLLRMPDGWRPLEPDLLKLIGLLQRSGYTAESLPVAEDYLARFGDQPHAARVRLKLAQRLVRDERPAKALRVLAEIADVDLPEDLRAIRLQLQQRAQRLRDEGVLELEEP